MKLHPLATALIATCLCAPLFSVSAQAFCGVIQESATASTAQRAANRANRLVDRKVRALKREHREKLQPDVRNVQCVGGGVAIDENGKQITGRPSCTATQSFCVNPS